MSENPANLYKFSNGTLKNKLNITDPNKLHDVEYERAYKNSIDLMKNAKKIKTNSLDDLSKIHQYMFGDIYYWAGVTRDNLPGHPDLEKNGHQFMPNAMMSNATQFINNELQSTNQKKKPDENDYANLLMDINDLHPFYEGNGRSCKTFLQLVAKHHGQTIEYPRHQKELINALNNLEPEQVAKFITVEDTKKTKPSSKSSQTQTNKESELEA